MSNFHVIKKNNQWAVKKVGCYRSVGYFQTQIDAKKAAIKFAENSGGGDIRIHDTNGQLHQYCKIN